MGHREFYTGGGYLQQNPGWCMEDSAWKAGIIAAMLRKHSLQPATVVEVGCGAGQVLQQLQQALPQAHLTGYDISPQAIGMAQGLQNERLRYILADYTQLPTTMAMADLVLVIDVVEHVPDFYQFLAAVKQRGKQFILHVPLDMACRTIHKPHVLLQQRQSVGHIHYFTKELVWWALADSGFTIKGWHYTKPRIDIDRPKGLKAAIKKVLRNISFAIAPHWSVKMWGGYSVMVWAE